MQLTRLDDYGINWQKGVMRVMGQRRIYECLLNMFLEDTTLARAKAMYAQGDFDGVFRCMHELKGACGNAEMTELYAAVCPLVELLRGGNVAPEAVAAGLAAVEKAYDRAKEGVALAAEA